MRSILITLLSLASTLASAQVSDNAGNASTPHGTLPGDTLTNEELGIVLHLPAGWTATEEFQNPVLFDPDPNAPANRCTHIELRYQAPANPQGGFVSWGILATLDRHCLSAGSFPKSDQDKRKVTEFVGIICKAFRRSPFIPRDGEVDFTAERAGGVGQVIVGMTGTTTLRALASQASSKDADSPIDTMISITEVKGRWLLWASLSDPATTEKLKTQSTVELWHK